MKTFCVVMPVTLQIEIEAATSSEAIQALQDAFDRSLGTDPMAGVKLTLPGQSQRRVTVATCTAWDAESSATIYATAI